MVLCNKRGASNPAKVYANTSGRETRLNCCYVVGRTVLVNLSSIGEKRKGSLLKGSFDKHVCIDLPIALPVPTPPPTLPTPFPFFLFFSAGNHPPLPT